MTRQILRLHSITDARPEHRGRVAVCGSHGGLFPGVMAARVGLRAVIFNDAGRGLDDAGLAGVRALGRIGMAAAAIDCMSARIGDADDMMARGRISHANGPAAALGVVPGMAVAEAARRLPAASVPTGRLPDAAETRSERRLKPGTEAVVLLDSASMVGPEHAGRIVVTGSHGALVGGDPARALKAPARVAVFNDAGRGPGDVALGRLPALEGRGIAAVTVAAATARIGEAASALETGVISALNAPARAMGAAEGRSLRDWLETIVASG